MKLVLAFILLFLITLGYSQEQSHVDSLEYEPIDTNNTHPIGFLLGGGLTMGNITGSGFVSKDTFSNWGTKKQTLFSVGLIYNKDFTNKFSFQSGAIFNLSKIMIGYTFNGKEINDTSNYSTLSIPLLFSYKWNNKPDGIKFSAGMLTEFDVSKKVDKNNRVFPLKLVSPAVYGAIGYQIKSYTSIFEVKLFGQINPMNLIKNNNSSYTNSVEDFHFWRAGIVLILR